LREIRVIIILITKWRTIRKLKEAGERQKNIAEDK
jgi:hypothetical protein